MRVIETTKASQCQRCGRPPPRCRCELKSSKLKRNKSVSNHMSRFVAETEKITGEDIRGALSLQITIKDTLQEMEDDNMLPVENDTCPRCVWKLKIAQESEETGSIINNVCEHCQLRAQIGRLKEERRKIVRDDSKHDKLKLDKQRVNSSQSRPPSDDQGVNILNQFETNFLHSSSEINILGTESAFRYQIQTGKKCYSETNLFKLLNEANLPMKLSEQKTICWDTDLAVAGLNKAPTIRSTSTISHLDSRDIKIKVQSDYPKAQPDSSEDSKKEVCIQMVKKNVSPAKTENLSDDKIFHYYFPTISKQESMVKHISSSDLIRDTQEKLLKKNEEKKHKVQELLRIQRLESINKRHERELRNIAEETQRQKRENRKFATEEEKSEPAEEERNKLVVKYSQVKGEDNTSGDDIEQKLAVKAILKEQAEREVKVKQSIDETINKVKQKVHAHDKDIKDTMFKLQNHTRGQKRKDVDKKMKREDEAVKHLNSHDVLKTKKEEEERVKHKVLKGELADKNADTDIAARKKQEVKKIDDIKKKEKDDAQRMHITKGIALKSQVIESASKKGDPDTVTKIINEKRKKEEVAKPESLKFEKEAQTVISKLKDETKKQEEKDRLRTQDNNETLGKQSPFEAGKKKLGADETVNIKKGEEKVDESFHQLSQKKYKGETSQRQEEAYLFKNKQEDDDRAREAKLKHEKDMEIMISHSKSDKKEQRVEDRIRDYAQKPMLEKQVFDDAAKKRATEKKREEENLDEKSKKEYEAKRKLEEDVLKKQQIADKTTKEVKHKADTEMQIMISKLKDETKEQKVEDSTRTQEEKVTLEKQSANKAENKKKGADESAEKKREEEQASEKKKKEEENARKKEEKENTLKKKHEEDEELKQKKRELEDEMKKMISKLKDDEKKIHENEKKQKDEVRMLAQDQNATEKRQVAEEVAKKKQEAVEAAKRKTEEEKADTIKNKIDVAKPEKDDVSKKQQEEYERVEKEKLKHEIEMKNMIKKLNDEKEANHKRDQEQKRLEEKQVADELTRKKRDAVETAKKKKNEFEMKMTDKEEKGQVDIKVLKKGQEEVDRNKQKKEAGSADQEQKDLVKKQSANKETAKKIRIADAVKQKLPEETLKKKQKEDKANEKRIKEEAVVKQKLELELKKKEVEKSQHEKELKDIILKLKKDTMKQKEEERIRDKEHKALLEKVSANDKVKQRQDIYEAATKKLEEEKAEKNKLEEEIANEKKKQENAKKELELEEKKKEEEKQKEREERRQYEQNLLKMIAKCKEDSMKQKEIERKKEQELKALLEKQAAENMARLRREADEAIKKKLEEEKAEKKKREEEIANEKRRINEEKAKKMQDDADLLKKKQEEENKIKENKLKYEEEMKKMILKLKEEAKKKKEQEWIQTQELKKMLEKKEAEQEANKKREKEELAKTKQEKEAAEKKMRDEETFSEKKRKEQEDAEKKREEAICFKKKREDDKKFKEEKLKYEGVMKKMILQLKEEMTKNKEQERIQAQEQKALLEKLAAVEEARKTKEALEAAKVEREIEAAEKKKRDEEAASEKKRKEQEEAKIKQEEANLLKKKQEEENRIKEEEKQLEKKIQIMAAQLKEETKKKNEEDLKRAQDLALILKQQAEVEARKKRAAEEEEKKNRKEEETEKKKQTLEIKEKQRLANEEALRVQREIVEAEKQKQAKEEIEKQKQRALDQDIRYIIAKQKQENEEQKKKEQELENAAKNMMLKQQAAVEVAKIKLEKQNAAADKVMELIQVEDLLEHTYDTVQTTVPKPVTQDIVIGVKISQYKPPLTPDAIIPMLFKKTSYLLDPSLEDKLKQIEEVDKKSTKRSTVPEPIADEGGVIRYALSDRSFIDKGWTVLPIEKVVRKMNVYRMRPAQPEFNWFEHNKKKRVLTYETGERLAEFDERGRCHWYYRNGRLALDHYEAEELNAQQRFVVYSNGEPDERGRARPFTVLATFDFLGSGVVFDHGGKIRLTYNQTEGVVLDRNIGPATTWKWHSLNDPPVLQQVMIDTKMAHKDPTILSLGDKKPPKQEERNDAQMVAIEFENFVKDKKKKLSQKFKPFQIKMKALKINENWSLKILDQATIYLIFREGSANIKLNIGMLLDHKEIIDTDTAELGVVNNTVNRFPAATDSIAEMQRSVEHAQRFERNRTERERILHPLPPGDSADRLVTGLSKPLKPIPKTIPLSEAGSKSNVENCKCSRKPTSNLYYNSRLA